LYLIAHNTSGGGKKIQGMKLFSTIDKLVTFMLADLANCKKNGYYQTWTLETYCSSYSAPKIIVLHPDQDIPAKAIRRGKSLWNLVKDFVPKDTQLSLPLG
jgi:hypothetical protein